MKTIIFSIVIIILNLSSPSFDSNNVFIKFISNNNNNDKNNCY